MYHSRGAQALVLALICLTSPVVASETAPNDVKYVDLTVPASLTGVPGDPQAGAQIFKDKKLGNCLACHANPDMMGELFHGNVGPSLEGVGDNWNPSEIRAIVVNSKAVFGPDTVMPGFYSLQVGKDVRKDLIGKTILTAQQVEDVVAYLSTLK